MGMNLKRKGQSLVEFSLILPILMLLLLGIIEGAHIIQAYISAQNASRQAARYAVSGQPLSPSGDPDWPSQADLTRQGQRAQSIKRIAIDASRGTGYTRVISTNNQFDEYYYDKCDTGSDAVCAGVLAVEVEGQGQDLNDVLEYQSDYPGLQGLNINVNV
jgi:Flp pilus assembly protein TadG